MFNFFRNKDNVKNFKIKEKHKRLSKRPDFRTVKKHIRSLNKVFGRGFSKIESDRIIISGFELKPITLKFKEIQKRTLYSEFRHQLSDYFDNGRWDNFKIKFTNFNDSSFCVVDMDTAEEIVKQIYNIIRNILKVEYNTKIFDCDDFYILSKSLFVFILYISGVNDMGSGIANVKINYNEGKNGHALNLIPIAERSGIVYYFYEPQRYCYLKTIDELIKDNDNYKDLRIFYFDM